MFWLAAASAAATVFSGYQAKRSADKNASLLREQGLLAQTDYEKQARIALDEGYRRRQQQTMDYIGAGVEIQGTPLLMLAETAKKTETQARELRTTGRNSRNLYNRRAKISRSEGRAAFISSIFTAGSQLAKG